MNASACRARVLLWMITGAAVLGFAHWTTTTPLVVYNPTDSVPKGWYRVSEIVSLHVGDYVLAPLPPGAALLAAQRGYLPTHIPIIKRIGAIPPQRVCVTDGAVSIDDVVVSPVLRVDRRRRTLPVWRECRRLFDGELFLLSTTNPASFDSRYFGPIEASSAVGRASPLWTTDTP